ncbi:hypothetical protein LCGC14_0237590 [marine sediment metagenome]|uniref:NAD-dependent epimerase/dehydratase domain-containing protein n=1 Tax=marine sediment metagenome TaxID=412755 RepID=A0A0F9XCG9_9ZZZZ
MKIIVVGAGGDIGEAACEELGRRHDLVRVGRSSGEIQVVSALVVENRTSEGVTEVATGMAG